VGAIPLKIQVLLRATPWRFKFSPEGGDGIGSKLWYVSFWADGRQIQKLPVSSQPSS
jgi:hypothetical protein